ncbi:MAG: hypothetical protein H6662_06290 [Ardenticatenaceae bacterium]|nr:hypothetical protein [Anaerolineales bacterium]MCB8921174.1 hypothetical protein [Ardenticatenaceae bacterium]MCB8990876.1 hypothetical protein [Ardenticatenaceae bacterium]MCB9004427.1 hypothetical protein [Ardenticatenaceae bacterium]
MSSFDQSFFVNREPMILGFQKLLKPTTRQAVMVVDAPRDMGKSWLVARLQMHCLETAVPIPAAYLDFRNPREIHEIQDALGLVRLVRNKLAEPTYFNDLNATINSFTSDRQTRGGAGVVTLRHMMERYFDLDDVDGLSFDLQIDFEELKGDTKGAKIRSLIRECEQQGRLEQLVGLCAQLRPSVDWSPVLADVSAVAVEAITPTGPDELIEDLNGRLWADSQQERQRAERQINESFFACLARLMTDKSQIAFLFDGIEEAPDVAEDWIRHELLLRLRDGQLNDIVVILTGRTKLDLTDLEMSHLLVPASLKPFTEDHVREYFVEKRNIHDPDLDIHTITVTSGGIPGALAMMADHAQPTVQDDDDFFSDL